MYAVPCNSCHSSRWPALVWSCVPSAGWLELRAEHSGGWSCVPSDEWLELNAERWCGVECECGGGVVRPTSFGSWGRLECGRHPTSAILLGLGGGTPRVRWP